MRTPTVITIIAIYCLWGDLDGDRCLLSFVLSSAVAAEQRESAVTSSVLPVDAMKTQPLPRVLDLKKVSKRSQPPENAVGGGKVYEGFITFYGGFRLGTGKWEGMVMTDGKFPAPAFFQHGSLEYRNEYTDTDTGISGSLYFMAFDDSTERFFLFGDTDLPASGGPVQRNIIAYDNQGNPLTVSRGNYLKALR